MCSYMYQFVFHNKTNVAFRFVLIYALHILRVAMTFNDESG